MDRTVVRHRDGTRPAVPATRVKPDGTRGVCPQIGLATASETRTIRPRSGAGCPARSRAPRSGSRSCGPDIVMIKIITINMNIDIIKIIKILISSYHKIIILIRLAAQTRADTGLTQMRAGQPSWPHTCTSSPPASGGVPPRHTHLPSDICSSIDKLWLPPFVSSTAGLDGLGATRRPGNSPGPRAGSPVKTCPRRNPRRPAPGGLTRSRRPRLP